MRGPLIESPTPPSRNPRRLATILALGVGHRRPCPGTAGRWRRSPAPDTGTPTTTTPAPIRAEPRRPPARPGAARPAGRAADRRRPRRRRAAAARTAPRLYTPPVGRAAGLPARAAAEVRRARGAPDRAAPAPPRETTPGRVLDGDPGDDADGEDDESERGRGAAPAASWAARSRPPTSAARIPNFFIGHFAIPPFLLSIYQAAGIQYGVPWEVLAAINEIETDYGRNLNVSTAGAHGLDAVHARQLAAPTASTPTRTAARTPTTPSTRSSRPRATSRPPAPRRICARRSSPTTMPTGTSTRCWSGRASSPACRRTSSAR